ncbi:twin-arginine translocation signal domain-containing protein [Natronococcus sp. A-GB7]|uniref:twin-arginine translocation signal domain-containing protein n=1 Tax=Natronococcus sp. A-GB7 TaxID=3037649 RepID=UPI00241F75B0|nr:twin-arginine translocation signal domain-containing protein [Natronococcus sp. A-GB7]MDG5819263.1 twin-arginine translocation signal domain-containing protein [Natronococcus sp. A-GB7]
MRDSTRATRRNVLKTAGAVGATAFIAGCNGNGNDEPDDEEPDDEEPANDEEPDENGEAIEPGTRIEFDAQTAGWVGIEPEEIADEENPTLTLQEGEEYEIGWEEGDGSQHNIEIRDEDDEVIDDLETEITDEGGDDQFLEFEASEEMATYVCEPHETTMVGDIEIEGNGEAEEDEEDDEAEDEMDDEEENGEDEMDDEEENGEDEMDDEEENGEDEMDDEEENGEDEDE